MDSIKFICTYSSPQSWYLRICVQVLKGKLSPAQITIVGVGHDHTQLTQIPFPSLCPVCLRPVQSSSRTELSFYKDKITNVTTGLVCTTSTESFNVAAFTDCINTISHQLVDISQQTIEDDINAVVEKPPVPLPAPR